MELTFFNYAIISITMIAISTAVAALILLLLPQTPQQRHKARLTKLRKVYARKLVREGYQSQNGYQQAARNYWIRNYH